MTQADAGGRPPDTSPWPPLYTPFKFLSPKLAYALRNAPVSSNTLTIMWGLLQVVASFFVAYERPLPAFGLVLGAVLLDCLDGDLARCRRRPSIAGTLLEQLCHWVANMALMVGAGAAILLADPTRRNVLLASTLAVVQCVYIVVVRQVRPDAANIPEHPRLRQAFRGIIAVIYAISPIELPLLAALVVFGVTETVVLVITVVLAGLSALVFVPHFVLTLATDRRRWAGVAGALPPFANLSRRYAQLVLTRLPEAKWWTPGAPMLPPEVLTLLGRQPLAAGSPVLASAWHDLKEQLPALFRTSGRALAMACPEDFAVEAVVGTLCRQQDEVLVVGSRSSMRRWEAGAKRLGVRVAHVDVPFGASLKSAELEAVLAPRPGVRAVCLPLSEAEDGTLTDLGSAAEMLRRRRALVMIDATLGFCVDDLRMDEWGIDVALSSSASGLMAPAGLSLLALGPSALEALESDDLPSNGSARSGGYLDLRTHLTESEGLFGQLPAPTLGGLYVATQMILAAGLDTLIEHRREIAERFRSGCRNAGLELVAASPTAATTTAVLPEGANLAQLQGHLFAALRMIVASSSTPDGSTTLQFGHAGWLFREDVDQAVTALTAAVQAARVVAPVVSRSSS